MIITDGRILKHFTKQYGMQFHKQYKYCTDEGAFMDRILYKGHKYKLRYLPGCFYPFLEKLNEENIIGLLNQLYELNKQIENIDHIASEKAKQIFTKENKTR